MKKILIITTILGMILLLWGCRYEATEKNIGPQLYYRTAVSDGTADQVLIQGQPTELEKGAEIDCVLDAFFQGPTSETMMMPFPVGTKVLDYHKQDASITLTLSSPFYYQKAIDRTISCACLTKTLLELTDVTSVTICAADRLEQDQISITMTQADILLTDETYLQP